MSPSCKAYSLMLLSMFSAATVQAGQKMGDSRGQGQATNVVRQADGSEIIRLAARFPEPPPVTPLQAKGDSDQEPSFGRWLDAMAAPHPMKALAIQPFQERLVHESIATGVDPSAVRSWAEYMDPILAMQWQMFAQMYGFSEALLRRPADSMKMQKAGGFGTLPSPGVDTGVHTTWSNVVTQGAKRSLTGQQAIQEWLKLPTPAPTSNPWLSNLGSYRY